MSWPDGRGVGASINSKKGRGIKNSAPHCHQYKAGYCDPRGYTPISKGVGRGAPKTHLHRAIAEAALGKPLPKDAQVHHLYGTSDNYSLVICPDLAYHKLIHVRERALEACGNPNFRKCGLCGTYDDQANLYVRHGRGSHHKGCAKMVQRVDRWRRNESKPFGVAGLLFEMVDSGNVSSMPFPGDEATEVDPMELTERSLRAAGFVKSPTTGEWIHAP